MTSVPVSFFFFFTPNQFATSTRGSNSMEEAKQGDFSSDVSHQHIDIRTHSLCSWWSSSGGMWWCISAAAASGQPAAVLESQRTEMWWHHFIRDFYMVWKSHNKTSFIEHIKSVFKSKITWMNVVFIQGATSGNTDLQNQIPKELIGDRSAGESSSDQITCQPWCFWLQTLQRVSTVKRELESSFRNVCVCVWLPEGSQ